MARLLSRLSVLMLALSLAVPAYALDEAKIWSQTCAIMGVPPGAVKRPQVVRLPASDPRVKGVWGFYAWNNDVIFVSQGDPESEATLAHEYAHAIMYSSTYQERIADGVEKYFK